MINTISLGEINVQLITEKLGDCRHFKASGAQLVKISIDNAIAKIKESILN